MVADCCARLLGAGRRFDLVSTRADGQPAYGVHLRAPDGTSHGVGPFERHVLPWFALPSRLPV